MGTRAKKNAKSSQNGSQGGSNPHREAWTALCRTHATLTGRLQETLADADMPPLPWYEVLDAVAASDRRRMKMGELAEALVISRGGLTKLVDRLVKAGLLERAFCAEDRRVSYAVMSPAGSAMFDEMQPIVVGELRRAFRESLSAREAAALRDGLVKVSTSACSI